MIRLLIGENSFEITHALDEIVQSFDGEVEKFDGGELTLPRLPDLFMGATLFASSRLVVIKDLSENKLLWNALPEWLERLSDDVDLVLVDTKPDQRTKTFKQLKKIGVVYEFPAWTDRDQSKAEVWVIQEAASRNLTLDKRSAQALVVRVGLDQWQLSHALEKLALLDAVTPETVEQIIEANPSENVFNLFEAALAGNARKITLMIHTLETTEDPYMVFGLLTGQAFQLAVLSVADKPSADVARDIGAHPFVLSKLSPHAQRLGRSGAKKIITAFATADEAMKISAGDPWLLVERTLLKVAST